MKKVLKWFGIVVASIVGLFILLVILVAIFAPRQSSQTPAAATAALTPTPRPSPTSQPTPTPTPKPSPTPQPTPTPMPKVGDIVATSNWEFKVTKVDRTRELLESSFMGKPQTKAAKGEWLILYLTLKNIGKSNFPINTWDFELLAPDNVKYKTSDDMAVYGFIREMRLTRMGEQIPPTVSVDSALVFDIAPGTKNLRLNLLQARKEIQLD